MPNTNKYMVPNTVLDDCLGFGFSYSKWKEEIEKRGYTWSKGLENTMIRREWEMFIDEIQQLRRQRTLVSHDGTKSNSQVSIIKRLQGERWADGFPPEKESRLHTRRLLGRDAK
jgi:methionine salvage enolase-phosphatase E1